MSLENLEEIAAKILESLEAKNAAREGALALSRQLVRHSANSIRVLHREEYMAAKELMGKAGEILSRMNQEAHRYPDIYFAGYVRDAQKEYAEARLTFALLRGEPLPDPESLQVEYAAYLNGLGEAVGEMRRHILDLIRRDKLEQGEEILAAMEEIYGVLATVDFPDAITGGLRRVTDMVRGVLKRTRGDMTLAIRQRRLEGALKDFEKRLAP